MPPASETAPHDARLSAGDFAARLQRLGPFAAAPRLAAGVSGGADSLALALLADDWVRTRGGSLLAFTVDHGLRPAAAGEARRVVDQLGARGIATRILTLRGLQCGPAQAARARAARLAALAAACMEAGIVDLLLGHHAADQAETLLMRALSRSGADGLAGIAALRHTAGLRILRPLLDVPAAALRAELRARGEDWVDDPSNADPAALRTRLRGIGPAAVPAALARAARSAAAARAVRDVATAAWLAAHAVIRPEGFAIVPPGKLPPAALAALLQMISGAPYPPAGAALRTLAANPRPATLGGVRLLPAGRWGAGLLLVREAAAMAPRQSAAAGVVWDGRFRLLDAPSEMAGGGWAVGPVGAAAARLRRHSALPAAVLCSLPALWRPAPGPAAAGNDDILAGLPQCMYRPGMPGAPARFLFDPPRPAACGPFVGA